MKAKKNTNGNIIVYSIEQFKYLFSNYTIQDGRDIINFYLSDKEVLESEGFFDVVVPEVQNNQKLGEIYFNEENSFFTYPVFDKTQEEIDALYRDTIPQIVTPRQLKTQLVLSGVNLSDIDNLISQLDEPQKTITQIAWEYSTDFDRNNPMILAFSPMLNLSETDVDNIFIAASQL